MHSRASFTVKALQLGAYVGHSVYVYVSHRLGLLRDHQGRASA